MNIAPLRPPDPPLGDVRSALILRPWRAADAPALVEAWDDREIAAHCGVPVDAGPARAAEWIAGWTGRADQGVAVDLVVAHAGTDAVMGEVGLWPFVPTDRTAGSPPDGAVELGWWMASAYRGAGRASVAVRLVADWALRAPVASRLVARIEPGHRPSEAVARHAGLTRLGSVDPHHDLWVRPVGATLGP